MALYDKKGALLDLVPQKYSSLDARKTVYNAAVTINFADTSLDGCSLYLYVWDNVKNMTALVNETQLR